MNWTVSRTACGQHFAKSQADLIFRPRSNLTTVSSTRGLKHGNTIGVPGDAHFLRAIQELTIGTVIKPMLPRAADGRREQMPLKSAPQG